ncbi:MAG TPA: carboxypeptidase-like regulatory domain-containing protein [Geobacteraceae bacterium]
MKARVLSIIVVMTLLFTTYPMTAANSAGAVRLHGVVTDPAGQPVADAEVFLYTSSNIRRPADFISPKTDRSGRYAIEIPQGDYWVVARIKRGERYGPLQSGDRHSGEPVHLQPADMAEMALDFAVADLRELAQRRQIGGTALVTISGRVVTRTGEPVPGVYVTASTRQSTIELPAYVSSWTDVDGNYALAMPPGNYYLGIEKNFPPTHDYSSVMEIRVVAGNLPVAIDLTMPVK